LQHLPKAFQSIWEYQKKDPFCKDIYPKVVQGGPVAKHFKLCNGTLVSHPSRAKRYVLPETLRAMVLQYFHGLMLSAHLGVNKTLRQIGKVFYWAYMRAEVYKFVRGCQDCQWAKPAQDSRVGLHSNEILTRPLKQVFIDYFGPIVSSRSGNMAILVVLDWFVHVD
jgi:hypothetical protein